MLTAADVEGKTLFPLAELLSPDAVPGDLVEFETAVADLLEWVSFTDAVFQASDNGLVGRLVLVLDQELAISPFGEALQLVLGGIGLSVFEVQARLQRLPGGFLFALELLDVPVTLRIPATVLRPLKPNTSEPDAGASSLDITVGAVTFRLGTDRGLEVEFTGRPSIPRCMIGDTGLIVAVGAMEWITPASATLPANTPPNFTGLFLDQVTVELAGLDLAAGTTLHLDYAFFGRGGFSGRIDLSNLSISGSLAGFGFELRQFSLTLVQNAITASTIRGRITIPFFDAPLDVVLGLNPGGGFTAAVGSPGGLLPLSKPGLLDLTVESVGFALDHGAFAVALSGQIKPRFAEPELGWPTFRVKELSIDSHGNVHLAGGWLDLPDHLHLDFHGFALEITKLGFGKDEKGGKWIGFSGGLQFVDGLTAGASVEGLRITWHDSGLPSISFNGIGVEFAVPEVLHFKGAVSYRTTPDGNHQFAGALRLVLDALQLEFDGSLVIGTATGPQGRYPYVALYVDLELPAGIPLGSTGLGLYGIAGLFALHVAPNRQSDQGWYENADGTPGWYLKAPEGVTDLTQKWAPAPGALGLGAGLTLGTVPDNGFAVNGRLLLVLSFPGPVLLLEGRANLLRERAKLGDNPMFRAVAVLDTRADTFLIGLDARYKYFDQGELIDLRGVAEAFFSFRDPSQWHVYLGRDEPRDQRIRAAIFFHLFEANAYFMLDHSGVRFGAWVGYNKHWQFGPLSVTLESWIEGNSAVSWKPSHVRGDYGLHGKAGLKVFGFGLTLGIGVFAATDVFNPFHIRAGFSVHIGLPWPLPDFNATIALEWPQPGGDKKHPPLPVPLKEVAIEHFKVTTKWPLPADGLKPLLIPKLDSPPPGTDPPPPSDGFLVLPLPAAPSPRAAPPDNAPVVPLDCRPHLTFGRPVHDDAGVGVNAQPVVPERERIGDPTLSQNPGPATVRYGLQEVALHRRDGQAWVLVARKGVTDNPPNVPVLFGSWAAVPQMSDGNGQSVAQTKLWLWSQTPFDYTLHTSGAWDRWFTGRFKDYPCVRVPKPRMDCCSFKGSRVGDKPGSPWHCPEDPRMTISWDASTAPTIETFGENLTLCFRGGPGLPDDRPGRAMIDLPEPAGVIRISLISTSGATATGYDADGNSFGPFEVMKGVRDLVISGRGLTRAVLFSVPTFWVSRVCAEFGPDAATVAEYQEMLRNLRDALARWSQVGPVLQPNTQYRLTIGTIIDVQWAGDLAGTPAEHYDLTQYAFFQTQGPPGLAHLHVPDGFRDPGKFQSGLDDLSAYVRQTVPATVPAPGEAPRLPRPVYRAYDVGVEFDEDYVDLLYRLDRRDLAIYLFDSNNRPVRDAQGRLIVIPNRWGRADTLTLGPGEALWVKVINGNDCAVLDTAMIPHDVTLGAPPQVLDGDFVYDARLIPLLLHEDFSQGLTGWAVQDDGVNGVPSAWAAGSAGAPPSPFVAQTSAIWGGTPDGNDPVKPGTMLLRAADPSLPAAHADQPANWTDYRVGVYVRSSTGNAVGLVFRYQDPAHYYRVSMDSGRRYRRLVRVVGGVHTVLAEDDFAYHTEVDCLLTVEAVGPSLRVYLDGDPVFDAADATLPAGGVGLYCWREPGARFSDVRVDDLRAAAPVPYRFRFTTSRFADFFHHLHSFQDETWRSALPAGADVAGWVAAAAPPAAPPTDAEQRAYEALAAAALGPAARQEPPAVEVTRLEANGQARGLLVRSPEPLDWSRVELACRRAGRLPGPGQAPQVVKLAEATFGTAAPNDESVLLLLRDAADLSGLAVEYRRPPAPVAAPGAEALLFADSFRGGDGLPFYETFGPNALDRYQVVDEGTQARPSAWAVSGDRIVQTSGIFGGSLNLDDPNKPGTLAVTGSASWADYRLSALVSLSSSAEVGVVFRYLDPDNYYRFSMARQVLTPPGTPPAGVRRLVKKVNGAVTVLWQDAVPYDLGHAYLVEVSVAGDRIVGALDNRVLFRLTDNSLRSGRVGLYCWRAGDAAFGAVTVEAVGAPLVLWEPAFTGLGELTVVDDPGTVGGPSHWSAANGLVTQTSNIHATDANDPRKAGSYAVGGQDPWEDVQVSVRLGTSAAGAVGVLFRYLDDNNYYRFSIADVLVEPGDNGDPDPGTNGPPHGPRPRLVPTGVVRRPPRPHSYLLRRLIKKVGGVVTVLWQSQAAYATRYDHDLTFRAVGGALSGFLDGLPLFDVQDHDLNHGRVGLFCSAGPQVRFGPLLVTDRTRRLGAWAITDEGTTAAPSVWRVTRWGLLQSSAVSGGAPPASPGTFAVAGDRSWTDYRLRVRLSSDAPGAIGVIFRHTDDNHYYRLSFDTVLGQALLVKKVNGVVTALWQAPTVPALATEFTLTIDAVGPRLAGYRDQTALFAVTDASLAAGRVGLYCRANTGARFLSVEVQNPPLSAYALFRDRFAAGDTGGWTVVDEGDQNVPSAWSAAAGALHQTHDVFRQAVPDPVAEPGTQAVAGAADWGDLVLQARVRPEATGAIGLLFRYADVQNYYRLSLGHNVIPFPRPRSSRSLRLVKKVAGAYSQLWEGELDFAANQVYELTVVAAGADLQAFVDGVPAFAVRDGTLAGGRIGLYHWHGTDAWFSDVRVYPGELASPGGLLDEHFNALVRGRWRFVDQGDRNAPSHWDVVAGVLRQTGSIASGDPAPAAPEKPGTVALAGDPGWADYRVRVGLQTGPAGAIGVLLRYRDAGNYYRFSMDPQAGYRRLVKMAGGQAVVLWQDAGPVRTDRTLLLTFDCLGNRLAGMLDGQRLFAVDDEPAAGQIGLYAWSNPSARFTSVRVDAAGWDLFYRFGAEPRLPAGARVRVYSGRPADAPAVEPNVVRRFTATTDDPGTLRLPRDGAALRLTDRAGSVRHARTFLPADAFTASNVRLLRKADGTGVILVPDGARQFDAGEYRLLMTYRRDNRANAPSSPILSESGDQSPERAVIDIPWRGHPT